MLKNNLAAYRKYGHALNSHDLLKAIAITLMVLDHVGYYFVPYATELRLIGRFSFPLFFFLIGYSRHYRFTWDIAILFLAMVVQDIMLHRHIFPVNILGNVMLTRVTLHYLSRWHWSKMNVVFLLLLGALYFPLLGLLVDFGVFGPIIALCGYYARIQRDRKLVIGYFIFACATYGVIECVTFGFSLFYSIIFLIALALMFIKLYHYRFETYGHLTEKNPVIHGVMLLSRYSLYVYVIHLMVFKLMKLAQYPELYIS